LLANRWSAIDIRPTTAMHLDDRLSIERISAAAEGALPRCRLRCGGQPTGCTLIGAQLEASVGASGEWLVFLTHDVPFEEALEIYLLDASFNIRDRATLQARYATGAFGNLQILDDRRLCFRFLGDGFWQLELLRKQGLRVPLFSEPFGVSRPFGFLRHFVISRRLRGLAGIA
jgi:hypothetical protein